MSDPVKIPIATQVRAADADLAHREKEYPGLIANGRMTRTDADADLQVRRAIVATLVLVQRFEQPIRDLCMRCLADIRAIERHPAVEAFRDAFPDARFIIHDLPIGAPEERPET